LGPATLSLAGGGDGSAMDQRWFPGGLPSGFSILANSPGQFSGANSLGQFSGPILWGQFSANRCLSGSVRTPARANLLVATFPDPDRRAAHRRAWRTAAALPQDCLRERERLRADPASALMTPRELVLTSLGLNGSRSGGVSALKCLGLEAFWP
jgi:hypothetical protein